METKQNEKQIESNRVNLCGLWPKDKAGMFSGKVNEKVVIEEGEYVNMFINNNDHEKAPAFNLVIYRATPIAPETPTYKKNLAEKLWDAK